MTFQALPANTTVDPKIYPRFIDIYLPMAGHKAIQYWWNPEGFWEPWETGMRGYATAKEAYREALMWAEAEELPYVEHPELA